MTTAPSLPPIRAKTCGLAVASLVLAILGLTMLPLLGSILGVVFGIIALNQIKRSAGLLAGRGQAIAGLITGGVGAVLITCLIIGLLAPIPFISWPRKPKLNLKPFEQLGMVMADKTARLTNNQGDVVLWRWETPAKGSAVLEIPIKHFRDRLSRYPKIRLIAEEVGSSGPPAGRAVTDVTQYTMSGEAFLGLIRKYQNASVLVIFGVVPKLTEEQIRELPDRRPKVLVVAMYDLPCKSLFENGVIQDAILPRFRPGGTSTNQPDDNIQWFERYYDVITPDTANALPW